MAENKNNSVCAICGKGYYLCLSCKQTKTLTPWKIHTDTSEHYKIYQILHGYSTGVYNKKEAKAKLKTVDLSDLSSFRDNIKETIQNILKDDESVVEQKKENENIDEISKKTTYKSKSTRKQKHVKETGIEIKTEVGTETD